MTIRRNEADFDAIDWEAWEPRERATLLFVIRGGMMLLIHKKKGLGAGKMTWSDNPLRPSSAQSAAMRPSGSSAFLASAASKGIARRSCC